MGEIPNLLCLCDATKQRCAAGQVRETSSGGRSRAVEVSVVRSSRCLVAGLGVVLAPFLHLPEGADLPRKTFKVSFLPLHRGVVQLER